MLTLYSMKRNTGPIDSHPKRMRTLLLLGGGLVALLASSSSATTTASAARRAQAAVLRRFKGEEGPLAAAAAANNVEGKKDTPPRSLQRLGQGQQWQGQPWQGQPWQGQPWQGQPWQGQGQPWQGQGQRQGQRVRAPSSHRQKLIHDMLAALFLAIGIGVVGLLACCVVRCEASRVFPCLAGRRRAASVAEGEVDIEESPGDKAADWQTRVGRPEPEEEEGKREGGGKGDGVMTTGVAAPVLLQAASTLWSASSSALLGLFGMGNSTTDGAGEGGEQEGGAKVQQLEAAETKQPEAQPAQ